MLVDAKGIIYHGRIEGMNPCKEEFASNTDCRTLADGVKGAFTPDLVKSMAEHPIIFALANSDPGTTGRNQGGRSYADGDQ